jgi:thiazole synthase ThiGH ThiG subunit
VAQGLLTNTVAASTSVLTLRINATTLGVIIGASWSVALGDIARTDVPFIVNGLITILSTGAGGMAWGVLTVEINTAIALATPTTMVVVPAACDTTQSNVIELACVSGNAATTWNFIAAVIEKIGP